MKFSLFYFPQVGMGDPNSYEARNVGNDPDHVAYLMEDLKLQGQKAEELGFWGVYFAEHHFDSEGFELCHNPLLFDAWVGMHTRRLRLGQLGLALPCWNPLRLAEDIATMTYMFPERLELGFVRGAFGREVAPLATAHQVEGAVSDHSEADERNRRLFFEVYEVLMKALREDFIRHEGEFFTIPPRELKWMNPATQKYGGGVTPEGDVTHLAVVPKPRNNALPPRWQAFSFSPETMRFAGREGMNLAMFELKPPQQRAYQEMFLEESQKAGRKLAFGDGVGYVRGMLCLEDREEAMAYDKASCDRIWGEWFVQNFTEAFRLPEDDPNKPVEYDYHRIIRDRGYSFCGTPDDVTRRIEELYENTNCEHVFFQVSTGGVPRDVLLRSMEVFAEKVMPRFDVESAPEPGVAAATAGSGPAAP